MKFCIYSVYDPETSSFDTRLNLGPLNPNDMAEQYRRAHIKMDEKDKIFMSGKKAIFLGMFDDETGKIEQEKLLSIYEFTLDKQESQVEEQGEVEGSTNA